LDDNWAARAGGTPSWRVAKPAGHANDGNARTALALAHADVNSLVRPVRTVRAPPSVLGCGARHSHGGLGDATVAKFGVDGILRLLRAKAAPNCVNLDVHAVAVLRG
jgi:hypothetical protein